MRKELKGCHKFWESNRNPITMKKCADENKLHIHNQSKEQELELERWRERNGRNAYKFIYEELEDISDDYSDKGFM
tara:strand:+ start:3589 stop:3816 length:228 start_codon:yes stop_codon:yes gene_type:complete